MISFFSYIILGGNMSYVISHRANGTKFMENTKEAILEIIKYSYVDGIEIDVRMTKDKKFILSHNDLIIDQNGIIKKISNTKYKDINKKITLLEDVLKSLKTNKYIVLDLKVTNKNTYRKNLMRLLRKHSNNYYLCSFDYDFLFELKKRYPSYKVGYLKGYFINSIKEKSILDFIFVHYISYKNEEGIWTLNKKEEIEKYKNKDIFIITDKPELF